MLLLSACASTARYTPQPIASSRIEQQQVSPDDEATGDSNAADNSQDESTESSGAVRDSSSQDVHAMLAEGEALYATGVAANLQSRWHDAQVSFERAIALLGQIDVPSVSNEQTGDDIDHLLDEIAQDYQKTLTALGQLPEDASSSAILLRLDGGLDSSAASAPPSATEKKELGEVTFDYPIEIDNPKVQKCIYFWQTVARGPCERFLVRAGRYLPMMKDIVRSYGIPADIAYLPFIESGFNNRAYSYAHASGPWQFIASTGRRYGLDQSYWMDERCDFEKSTHAACKYLGDLYRMFGSWNLALAAYNGGEGRVGRQIKRQRTDEFWQLKLRDQTRNYVPLYMAALMIAKDPAAYGFQVQPDPPLAYDWVATNKPLEFKDIANALGTTEDVISDLNPELRRGVTPPDISPYRLRVPKGSGDLFASVYHDLPRSTRTEWAQHTVRKGETLGKIAKRYGVSAGEIASVNKLSSKHRLTIGQALVIPIPSAAVTRRADKPTETVYEAPAPRETADAAPPAENGGQKYTVQAGDTFWDLAKKFGLTTSTIRQANRMEAHDRLQIGQTLIIPKAGGTTPARDGGFWYTVRRGDTILRIATKFGKSVAEVLAFNSLDDPDEIHIGQKIRIPSDL
jgi:membrane-bound lytic murein transglycosylase D